MKTKKTEFNQTVGVWAIPKTSFEIEQSPKAEPFYFQVQTNSPWQNGAVKVHEENITITVPEGIDLTAKAIETLELAKAELYGSLKQQVADIDSQIKALTMIEHIAPEEEFREGICIGCGLDECRCDDPF